MHLYGTLDEFESEAYLQLKDGCAHAQDNVQCRAFYVRSTLDPGSSSLGSPHHPSSQDQVMDNGLHEALNIFLRDGRIAMAQHQLLNNTEIDQRVSAKSIYDSMADIHVINRLWLQEGMERSITIIDGQTEEMVNDFGGVLIALAVTGILVMFAYFLVQYRPSILFMVRSPLALALAPRPSLAALYPQDRDQKRVRTMLLLLPEDVITNLDRVKALFRDITRQLSTIK